MRRIGSGRICSGIVFAAALFSLTIAAQAQVICISNNVPPPELPVYDQPAIPAPGYIWTPGYWAGGPSGYFWVPGTWVEPPETGLLWTPGYWSWRDGVYIWTAGYWGPHVGFYGGIDYGFGYGGDGYEGGRWENGVFAYNRTVNNFGDVRIVDVYERPVIVNQTDMRVSFNGGSGGIMARPTPQDEAYRHEQHVAADQAQLQHERIASADKSLLASENHGHPTVAATAKPGEFTGKGVVAAREATPVNPAQTKPAGVGPGTPNPGVTRLPEGKPLEGKPLENKPPERGEPNANLNGAKPLPGETKPLTPEGKPLENKPPEKREGNLNGTTPPKPLPGEGKPLTPESKPLAPQGRPLTPEAKPLTPAETKPVDTGRKLPESGPANHEAKLPPPGAKPELAPATRAPTPPAPPPHLAVTPPPHPAPPAAPAAHPPAGPQNAKPDPKDKKPPG